ncbi:MAG: guanylate kinase, partial [Clostridia bacterium]
VKCELLKRNQNLVESISVTTRKPRPMEIDGVSYYFKSEKEFDDLILENQFLEYCGVFERRYGTLREFVDEKLAEGKDVLLEIDVQGALKVRGTKQDAVLIMLVPPSLPDLVLRLQKRNTETEDEIKKRFAKAKIEMEQFRNFDYIVINDDIETACKKIESIIKNERYRSSRNTELIGRIINQ